MYSLTSHKNWLFLAGNREPLKYGQKKPDFYCPHWKVILLHKSGHQEYINKLEVSKCNKYIISSAGDGIRFFLIKDMTTLGGWKSESIIDIMSVYDEKTGLSKFLFGDKKNLYVLDELKMLAAK